MQSFSLYLLFTQTSSFFKMKLKVVLMMSLVASVYCKPQSIIQDGESTTEEVAISKLDDILDQAPTLLIKEDSNRLIKILVPIFINSVNKTCLLNKYRSFGLFDEILVIDRNQPSKFSSSKAQTLIVFAVICSSKIDSLYEFGFELLMSTHVLFEAFINEPEMKEYADMLTCANSYAVQNNLLDPKVFKFNYKMNDENEISCNQMVKCFETNTEMAFNKALQLSSAKCIEDIGTGYRNLVFKNFLLVQFELTGEQRKQMGKTFVDELRAQDEKWYTCVLPEALAALKDKSSEVNTLN